MSTKNGQGGSKKMESSNEENNTCKETVNMEWLYFGLVIAMLMWGMYAHFFERE